MGYAPQFDGFLDDLTVHEMLYILGTIRGIPSNKINIHIDKWLTIFGNISYYIYYYYYFIIIILRRSF